MRDCYIVNENQSYYCLRIFASFSSGISSISLI
jgi:hypothetical protein